MYAVVYNWGFVWTCAVVMFIFLNFISLFIMYVCFLGVHMEGRQQRRVCFLLIIIKVLGIELRLSSMVASTLPTRHLGTHWLVFLLLVWCVNVEDGHAGDETKGFVHTKQLSTTELQSQTLFLIRQNLAV